MSGGQYDSFSSSLDPVVEVEVVRLCVWRGSEDVELIQDVAEAAELL